MDEMKTQVMSMKNKLFDGEVTMQKKDFAFIVAICVLGGMVLGLSKKARTCKCTCEDKEKKDKKER